MQEAEYARVIADMNARRLEFVTHIGDMMFDPRPYERDPSLARMPCTDENYAYVMGTFQSCRHPLVLTPGDNDWTDVVQFKTVKMDPLDRLQKVRSLFFPKGRSLGQRTMPVVSQADDPGFAKFVENLTWKIQGLRFATLHTVRQQRQCAHQHGGAQGARGRECRVAEEGLRQREGRSEPGPRAHHACQPGVREPLDALVCLALCAQRTRRRRAEGAATGPLRRLPRRADRRDAGYAKPVLYVHGDTHIFRIGKPLLNPKTERFFENLTRLETFGWPDSAWVRVAVDPSNPHLFEIYPEIVPGNSANYAA